MGNIYLIRRTLPSLGDAVSLEPLVSLVHEQVYKQGELWLQLDSRNGALYQNHPYVNRILSPKESVPSDISVILDINNSAECPLIQHLFSGGRTNAAKILCKSSLLKVAYDGRSPRLYLSDDEKEQVEFLRRSFPKKKIAVQVKASHHWKTYPYLEKLKDLLLKEDYHVFLTNDDEIFFKYGSAIPLISLPYRSLMIWLAAMDLFIGYDSGPTHIAATFGVRTYAIFGPTDPREIMGMYGAHVTWNKRASLNCPRAPCWLRHCEKVICLKALSPNRVFSDCKKILKEEYKNPRLQISSKSVRPILPITNKKGDISKPALMRLDGLGGTVTLSDHAKKIHELTGEKVTMITRGYEVLFEDNPHVERVINVGMKDWKECSLVMRHQFDALAEIRFGIGKWYSQNGHFPQDFGEFDALFNQFPKDFNQLAKYGLHHIQLTDKTLNLDYEAIETEIFVDEEVPLEEEDFILMNNGVDFIHGSMRQTKCWDGWDKLIPLLEKNVVQCGTANDKKVDGAIDLRGRTNLKQLIYLIRKAKLIIATEGGIMHLAHAAGNPNMVVLGGPTQGPLFQYPSHKWITSHVCGNCWSTTPDWYVHCPKDSAAVCMKTILPETVAEVANEHLA